MRVRIRVRACVHHAEPCHAPATTSSRPCRGPRTHLPTHHTKRSCACPALPHPHLRRLPLNHLHVLPCERLQGRWHRRGQHLERDAGAPRVAAVAAAGAACKIRALCACLSLQRPARHQVPASTAPRPTRGRAPPRAAASQRAAPTKGRPAECACARARKSARVGMRARTMAGMRSCPSGLRALRAAHSRCVSHHLHTHHVLLRQNLRQEPSTLFCGCMATAATHLVHECVRVLIARVVSQCQTQWHLEHHLPS